jgi:hypothetical protein
LSSAGQEALGKEIFEKKNKTPLSSASHRALGKEIFEKKKIFTKCLQGWHSAK